MNDDVSRNMQASLHFQKVCQSIRRFQALFRRAQVSKTPLTAPVEMSGRSGDEKRSRRCQPKEWLALICSLSLFSIFGETARIVLEQVFGQACHKENVGWNRSNWAPCTTAPGTTASTGGAVFTDLPANMVGCFVMGFFVSGDEFLGIPVDLPVAFLARTSKFQRWTLLHLGLRTGFCGSLTTFASWNTQMIVMICNGKGSVLDTQWVSALFGYAIGLGMALICFAFGRHMSIFLHRRNNPDLAKEADHIYERQGMGILIHRDLPDFERRFLQEITIADMSKEEKGTKEKEEEAPAIPDDKDNDEEDRSPSDDVWRDSISNNFHHLQKWKDTTEDHRNGRAYGGQWQSELRSIEEAMIIRGEEPRDELLDLARDAGWDIQALRNWTESNGAIKENQKLDPLYPLWVTAPLLFALGLLLLWGTIVLSDEDPYTQSYRISCLSILIAPTGTLLRYYLSSFNGKIKSKRFEWLPLGTLLANLLASIISALAVALNIKDTRRLSTLWLSAIKGGFAGCLSTVSTFIVEVEGLARALPQRAWAYYYAIGSLILACLFGICSYIWAVV